MRKIIIATAAAAALAVVPVTFSATPANATHEIGHAILGGIIGGVIGGAIANSVANGQNHCHEGLGCHSHAGAKQYHYHQYVNGPVLYQQVVQPQPQVIIQQPAPVYQGGGYSAAHYNWCAAKYKSYHAPSNTYQPYGAPRRPCYSPYGG
jgi:hypothetical protein